MLLHVGLKISISLITHPDNFLNLLLFDLKYHLFILFNIKYYLFIIPEPQSIFIFPNFSNFVLALGYLQWNTKWKEIGNVRCPFSLPGLYMRITAILVLTGTWPAYFPPHYEANMLVILTSGWIHLTITCIKSVKPGGFCLPVVFLM